MPDLAKPLFPLHAHSTMSMLDGASSVGEYVKYCKDNSLQVCSCTDHGWLSGLYDLMSKSKKAGVKPVPGCEFYLMPRPDHVSDRVDPKDFYFHITVWAYNQTGYANLLTLGSRSWDEGKVVVKWGKPKPRISWSDLRDYGEGLLVGTGCIEGPIGKCLLNGEVDEAVKNADTLRAIFGDRLFFEVMPLAVDRDYVREKSVVVEGDGGKKYRFKADDILQTDLGEMTAAEAVRRRPSEIIAVLPTRVQDYPFDDCPSASIQTIEDVEPHDDSFEPPPISPIVFSE